MIKFETLKYIKVHKGSKRIPKNVQVTSNSGNIDPVNLRMSNYNDDISLLPISAQKELNSKGNTTFTVVTKTTITIYKVR